MSAGKEDVGIDMAVEGIRRPILINFRKDSDRASLLSETTNPLDEALITVATADPHIMP